VLGCFDRVVVNGTISQIAHPAAMQTQLYKARVRCFDLPKHAQPMTDLIHMNARALAKQNNAQIQFIRGKQQRKEDLVEAVLAKRGRLPGLAHIIETQEKCLTFKACRNDNGKTGLVFTHTQCAVYYFHLIDEDYGLMFVRVPTWLPCTMQVYFNMHNHLANRLRRENIAFETADNSFTHITRWERAQKLADRFDTDKLQRKLDMLAATYCPIVKNYNQGVYWTVKQIEYSLDIAFQSPGQLAPIYEETSRQAVLAVKAPDIARFWERKHLSEATSDYRTQAPTTKTTLAQTTRIKHTCGKQTLKMYDKNARVLRIEATSNNINFFKHYRKVVGRDKRERYKNAALGKSIHNLGRLRELMRAVCERYLDFIGQLESNLEGAETLEKISAPVRDAQNRALRGFNLFLKEDRQVIEAMIAGEHRIHGMDNKTLRKRLEGKSSSQTGRILRRLRKHALIKKVSGAYRYYVTKTGGRLLVAAIKMRRQVIIPALQPESTPT
jgi:hypothetical protein